MNKVFPIRLQKLHFHTIKQPLIDGKRHFQNSVCKIISSSPLKTGRVTLQNVQIITGEDCQIPACAVVKPH